MKTWSLMYGLIWVGFLQILIILFPVFGEAQTYLHAAVGVVVLVMAYLIFTQLKPSACPKRIKMIAKTTLGLAVFQGALGLALVATLNSSGVMGAVNGAVQFLHAANAIAIITQASSSATSYDMWEEKEFVVPDSAPPSTSP